VAVNRINRIFGDTSVELVDRVESVATPTIPTGFTACPPQMVIGQPWQQALYQWAYQQAVAASIFRVLESRFRRLGLG
jgi:hypothetical protein